MVPFTLDVGCGENPRGTINCDITIGHTKHFMKMGYGQKEGTINPKLAHIPNFVQCDSHYLPFKSDSFELVSCSHCLEHIRDWPVVFKELMRVSGHKVEIRVPHRMSRSGKFVFYRFKQKDVHVAFFDLILWHQFLKNKYRYIVTMHHQVLHNSLIDIFLPFLCPVELFVEVWK